MISYDLIIKGKLWYKFVFKIQDDSSSIAIFKFNNQSIRIPIYLTFKYINLKLYFKSFFYELVIWLSYGEKIVLQILMSLM